MMFWATVCDTYPYNTESYNTERASGFMSLCEAMKPPIVRYASRSLRTYALAVLVNMPFCASLDRARP